MEEGEDQLQLGLGTAGMIAGAKGPTGSGGRVVASAPAARSTERISRSAAVAGHAMLCAMVAAC